MKVLTGTLDYLKDVVGMQLSQFPLPDINKVQSQGQKVKQKTRRGRNEVQKADRHCPRWWSVTRGTWAASSSSSWEWPSTVPAREIIFRCRDMRRYNIPKL